jgi:uncharacterized protein
VLGTLRLPLLLVVAGSPAAGAGTNIAISAAAAASGGARHAREGRVSWPVVAWMAPPSVVGAVLGALLGHRVPDRALFAAVAAVLLWQGVELIARPFRGAAAGPPRRAPAVGSGFVIGLVGGALGVILGTLRMPALLRAVRLPASTAVGTNLVVGFLLGVAGFAAHATRLEVEWNLLGAGLAARLTGRLSERTLRRAIGAALLAIAAAFAVHVVRG